MIDFSMYDQKQPQVFAKKCPECGTLWYPAPMICGNCNNRRDPSGMKYSTWDDEPLEGPCTLLAWTRVFALPEGFDKKYLLFGIVEFENGLRASGRVLVDNPETGMKLVAKADTVKEVPGREIYGLFFDRPG